MPSRGSSTCTYSRSEETALYVASERGLSLQFAGWGRKLVAYSVQHGALGSHEMQCGLVHMHIPLVVTEACNSLQFRVRTMHRRELMGAGKLFWDWTA